MLTKKASKQKSQDDMMNAIDRLSNVKRNKEKLPPKVDSIYEHRFEIDEKYFELDSTHGDVCASIW